MKNKVVISTSYGGFGLSKKAINWLKHSGVRPDDITSRHDKVLVRCVEVLGKEANGDYAELEVVEIEGDKYRICEYDGAEWVETPDTIEWTVIK